MSNILFTLRPYSSNTVRRSLILAVLALSLCFPSVRVQSAHDGSNPNANVDLNSLTAPEGKIVSAGQFNPLRNRIARLDATTARVITANGTFNVTNHPITNFAGWAKIPNAKPLVGDFNDDGKTDVALTGPAGWSSMPVAFSNGNGTFNVTNHPVTDFAGWANAPNAKPLVGDFNGDGKTDVALTGPAGWSSMPVAFSNGNGTFNVTNHPITNFAGWANAAKATPLVGDFNGDGKTDVALTGPAGWSSMPVAFSNEDGTFNVTNHPITNFAGWANAAKATPLVGDFNGDGKTDAALTGPAGWSSMPVAFSNGNGTFNVTNHPITDFAGWANAPNAKPLVGDFNGDGKTDVALTGPAGWSSMPVAFSKGNGTFNVTNHPITNFAGWANAAKATPLVGDFNGDGKTDVALTGPTGWSSMPVAFSNENGTFNVTNHPITNFAGWANAPNAKPLVGDFNGDGKTDVALTGPTGWSSMPVAFSN